MPALTPRHPPVRIASRACIGQLIAHAGLAPRRDGDYYLSVGGRVSPRGDIVIGHRAPVVRQAAVAGSFYPDAPAVLKHAVSGYLGAAQRATATAPKAIIAPHAGFIYSGPIAGSAYAALASARGRIKRVVLLGPAHRVALRGLALPGADAFDTPLGRVLVDAAAVAALGDLPQVSVNRAAHAAEHSLEVQLPFLQQICGDFELVPLVVGDATPNEVAAVLERLWGGDETLIVVSSDLSHYLPYREAQQLDAATAQAIVDLAPQLDRWQACGATPINGLLALARRRGMRATQLDLRNSGDTAGDRGRVVGYGAIAFHESTAPVEDADSGATEKGQTLLHLARGAIAESFGLHARGAELTGFLSAPGASFVTLRLQGELRGCIGSLEARRALGEDVRHNACAAAFSDPRFGPLVRRDFEAVRIEVSVLSSPQPLAARDEADLRRQLRPHVDGVILRYEDRRATFLPKVWQALPDTHDFLAHLRHKAGLPSGFWHDEIRFERYTTETWSESEPWVVMH